MKIGGNLASGVIVLMAASSLFLMVCLLQIDRTIHHDLYLYGLQFNYQWARPYWIMIRAAFALAWFNIIAAITVQLYTVTFRRREVEQLVTDVAEELRRTEVKPKDSRGPALPETRELMKLFATATPPTPSKQIEDTPTQQDLKDVTIELQQHSAEIVESEELESDHGHAPAIPTQTTQRPSKKPIVPSTTSQSVNPTTTAPAPVLIPSAPTGRVRCPHCRKTFTQPSRRLDFHDDRPRIIDLCPFCNEILLSETHREKKEQNKRPQLNEKDGDQTTKTLHVLEKQQK